VELFQSSADLCAGADRVLNEQSEALSVQPQPASGHPPGIARHLATFLRLIVSGMRHQVLGPIASARSIPSKSLDRLAAHDIIRGREVDQVLS